MINKIDLSEFAHYVYLAEKQYPNAKVTSVGYGCAEHEWYYALFLDVDGCEVRYEIPMYKEEGK